MEKIQIVLWDELTSLPTTHPAAELLGFLDVLPHRVNNGVVRVICPKLAVIRRLLKLWKGLKEAPFNATIMSGEETLELDKKRGKAVFNLSRTTYNMFVEQAAPCNTEQRWAWFRGVWGGCGAVCLPQNGYYMTLRIREYRKLGARILQVLRSAGIMPGRRVRNGSSEYTIRDQEQIVTCLSKMGLVKTSLLLEETAIVRSLRNRANMLVNCDSANISKSLSAAREQLALIDRLDAEGMWDRLSPNLTELAHARRANPSASLRELGQILSKPVSKSTVEYRWKKLEALIEGQTT